MSGKNEHAKNSNITKEKHLFMQVNHSNNYFYQNEYARIKTILILLNYLIFQLVYSLICNLHNSIPIPI